jgi:hypothetical protein
MPWAVRKQNCTKSDGSKGSYVLIKTTTGEKVSCHTTKADAEAARRAREANSND